MGIIYSVPQAHCVVIERFGKYARTQREGMRFKLPWMEKVRRVESWGTIANKRGFQIELTEQQMDTPKRKCHTSDNVPVTANAVIFWRIVDPRRALYEVDVLPKAIIDVALNALRANIGLTDLDTLLSDREGMNTRIAAQLAETAAKWGIQFTRVEIQEIETDDKVAKSMQQQMDAERERRSIVARAEGRSEAAVMVAEAQKKAAILRAEGHAKSLEIISHAEQQYLMTIGMGVSDVQAAKLLMAQKYIDGFEKITANPAHKVFLPNNFSALFSFPVDDEGPSGPVPVHPDQLDADEPHFDSGGLDDDLEEI
jgi:regulator of protease activity HflC (stomatin/prohibitin superfamily)